MNILGSEGWLLYSCLSLILLSAYLIYLTNLTQISQFLSSNKTVISWDFLLNVNVVVFVVIHQHWLLLLLLLMMDRVRLRLPHKLTTNFLMRSGLHFVSDYSVFKLTVPACEAAVNMQSIQLVLRQQNKYLMFQGLSNLRVLARHVRGNVHHGLRDQSQIVQIVRLLEVSNVRLIRLLILLFVYQPILITQCPLIDQLNTFMLVGWPCDCVGWNIAMMMTDFVQVL